MIVGGVVDGIDKLQFSLSSHASWVSAEIHDVKGVQLQKQFSPPVDP